MAFSFKAKPLGRGNDHSVKIRIISTDKQQTLTKTKISCVVSPRELHSNNPDDGPAPNWSKSVGAATGGGSKQQYQAALWNVKSPLTCVNE